MKPKEKCTISKNDSMIKVQENGRKATFRNHGRENYKVSEVDGCLITDGERCDYLVSRSGVASVLVELKGADVQHACDQLMSTVKREEVAGLLEKRLRFLVICKRYPRFDTFVAKAKIRAAKEFKAGFHVVCDKGEFDIERVAAIDGPF